ncbi:hypothetical protein Pla175_17740 [Pirellulimonas nuda]|uniref:Uncharacterized protein n=1 Tax=Pirellulimonas nuda TaxID=2528009 RepID=A0A518DAB7_9BACT|nr:hypothetical protein [Pirellulimonas nuda]QDU88398.1 hypothetical protein Pla175_17740 [Pirellulimonas nuda]
MPNVRVIVVFKGHDSVPTDVVIGVIKDIERIAYKVERSVLDDSLSQCLQQKYLTSVEVDAIQYRFDAMKGASMMVRGTERGSLILTLVGGGAAIWLIKNTVGESLREGYKGSALDMLLQNLSRKGADYLGAGIKVAMERQSELNLRSLDRSQEATRQGRRLSRIKSALWTVKLIEVDEGDDGVISVRAWMTYEEASIETREYIRMLEGTNEDPPPQQFANE